MKSILTVALFLFSITLAAAPKNNWEWQLTNFDKHSVDFSEIISGGPPKDGIPAVDNPKFVNVNQASRWIKDKEPVILVRQENLVKAYPLQIMMYHEIVNDWIDKIPVSVTFCPLCNASIVFHRKVGSKLLDFGTTGRLRNSDLVMYDRQTESWWQQFTGEAIVGDYTGTQLEMLHSAIISFSQFKKLYPQGKVLSRDTGNDRPYGRNPYVGYDDIDNKPFLLTKPVDNRLPPMERVISVTIKNKTRIYPFEILDSKTIVNDEFMGEKLVIVKTDEVNSSLDRARIADSKKIPAFIVYSAVVDGKALSFEINNKKILDKQTGTRWSVMGQGVLGELANKNLKPIVHGQHFAFAWLAFDPNVDIFISR